MAKFKPGITVISGPSGVGKNTVIHKLFEIRPELRLAKSLTTRAARGDEFPGQYEHVSKDEFLRRANAGELLEWAQFGENYYGTLMLDPSDTTTVLEIDYQGAGQVKGRVPSARLVFLLPPGNTIEEQLDVLERRLHGRGNDSPEARQIRLAAARREIEMGAAQADLVVVNDEVDRTAAEISAALFD